MIEVQFPRCTVADSLCIKYSQDLTCFVSLFVFAQYLDLIKQSSGDWNDERVMLLRLASYEADLVE